ncbi:MAG: TIGR01777 family oxidoreductase [Acidimicrobiales bacterium]|nr:TIGR01777 family oxidoreductase [Acidimicrobiales bacterium]
MQVAITGASGLIGTALTRSLRDDGHAVRPVVRRDSDDPAAIRWDPAAGTIDAAAFEGLDVVVHLAGAGIGDKRWSADRKREILESRTRGTGLIARTLADLATPPATFVSASAVGYYGSRADAVLTETSEPGDDFVAGVVQAWEAATRPAVDAGIRTVLLRTAPVLSADGGILPRMALPFRFFVGGRLGSGDQWMSWISLDDVVAAIRFLMARDDVAGPVNVTAPEPVTNREMSAALGRTLHRPSAIPVPALPLQLALGREMADSLLFVSQRVHPRVLLDAGFTFTHATVDAALADALGTSR